VQRTYWQDLWADRYYQDLTDGKLDPFMISIYKDSFKSTSGIQHIETKAGMAEGFMPAGYAHLKNDSIPMEHLLAVNGLDEDFDECHCYQDSELSERLFTRRGMLHYLMPTNKVELVDAHSLLMIRKILRPEPTNAAIYNRKRSQGYAVPVNKWSLVQKRQEIRSV
jgi:hypothetical protein